MLSHLRKSIGRGFYRQTSPYRYAREVSLLADDDVLHLLLDTDVDINASYAKFRAHYESTLAISKVGLPPFDEAIERGWFRVIGEQIVWSVPFQDHLRNKRPIYASEVLTLIHWSWKLGFKIRNIDTHGNCGDFPRKLLESDSISEPIPVASADWVAARLWELSTDKDLMHWQIKRELLGSPNFNLGAVWKNINAIDFCESVVERLRSSHLSKWGEFPDEKIFALAETGDVRNATVGWKDVRGHLLGKYLDYRHQYADELMDRMANELAALSFLVLESIATRENDNFPHPATAQLVELGCLYPSVLSIIFRQVQQEPRLMADLLMESESALLAIYLMAAADRHPNSSDSSEIAARAQRTVAFDEAVVVLKTLFRDNKVDPSEFAALVAALEAIRAQEPEDVAATTKKSIDALLGVLKLQSEDMQGSIIDALIQMDTRDIGSSEFGALLDCMTSVFPGIVTARAKPVMELYVSALEPRSGGANLNLITAPGAKALIETIGRLEDGKQFLLRPFDVKARLQVSAEIEYTTSLELGRAVRNHIRVLARALSATAPKDQAFCVDALARSLVIGAQSHKEKGKVPALSGFQDSFMYGQRQVTLSDDLTLAIRSIKTDEGRKKIVEALLETDEPGLLASLLNAVPNEFQDELRKRISKLGPDAAAPAVTITELQSRIRDLLAAGLVEPADKYIAALNNRRPGGKAPDRDIETFRVGLHLKLLLGDFEGLFDQRVPEGLNKSATDIAEMHLAFYVGLAHLRSPNSDPQKAAAIFSDLARRYPNSAHSINLFAARRAICLRDDSFAILDGALAERASYAISDAEKSLKGVKLSGDFIAVYLSNRASLELALQLNQEARMSLHSIGLEFESAEVVALDVVALHRLGRSEDAIRKLQSGFDQFPGDSLLEGAKKFVEDGKTFRIVQKTVSVDLPSTRFKEALFDFAALDPDEQARVFYEGDGALPRLVTKHVRNALATIDYLSPFLKLRADEYTEDDLNALLCEVLDAHTQFPYQWSTKDQSKGGNTAGPGRGERDIVLRKEKGEIAVIEAMKVNNIGYTVGKNHFKKIFDYSGCKIFFHVTYFLGKKKALVMENLEKIAKDPDKRLTVRSVNPINAGDSRPDGWIAHYLYKDGEALTVVFLLVDLVQSRRNLQRTAE